MTKIKNMIAKFRKDEEGASFLEYTVLLGIILAASIVLIANVGKWAGNVWTLLNTTLISASN
jgi:pilus assembly protein Flp/PilA